jgi:hypothetical protein
MAAAASRRACTITQKDTKSRQSSRTQRNARQRSVLVLSFLFFHGAVLAVVLAALQEVVHVDEARLDHSLDVGLRAACARACRRRARAGRGGAARRAAEVHLEVAVEHRALRNAAHTRTHAPTWDRGGREGIKPFAPHREAAKQARRTRRTEEEAHLALFLQESAMERSAATHRSRCSFVAHSRSTVLRGAEAQVKAALSTHVHTLMHMHMQKNGCTAAYLSLVVTEKQTSSLMPLAAFLEKLDVILPSRTEVTSLMLTHLSLACLRAPGLHQHKKP